MGKFWNFIKNEADHEEIELRIEGDIIDDDYAWLYEWFDIQAASPNAFRSELQEYSGKNITVWIDSWGGDVTAAAGIYNSLKEHKGKVTVKIDGKAVSAASVIAMAGDEIKMSPVAIMMIHNPWTGAVGEAKDMRHTADILDEIKDTIINAYQFKTGKSRNKISKMMDEETWMSTKKALSEGFIDEMLYADNPESEPVENSFMFSRMAIQNRVTESTGRIIEQYQKLKESNETGQAAGFNNGPKPANEKEDKELDIKNVEDLKQQFPDLVNQIEAKAKEEGAKDERERIKSIDEISATVDQELVTKAKYDEPMTAQELAFQALKADAAKGQQYLNNRADEISNSGTGDVPAGTTNTLSDDTVKSAVVDKIAGAANAKRKKEDK